MDSDDRARLRAHADDYENAADVHALLDHINQLERMLADVRQEALDERAACLDLLHNAIPRLERERDAWERLYAEVAVAEVERTD